MKKLNNNKADLKKRVAKKKEACNSPNFSDLTISRITFNG